MPRSSRPPRFYNDLDEKFYNETSKRELFEMLRTYGIFDTSFDCADDALRSGEWVAAVQLFESENGIYN